MRWMEKRRPDSAEMLSGGVHGPRPRASGWKRKKGRGDMGGKADSAVITLARAPSAVPLSGQMIASLAAWPEPAPLPSPSLEALCPLVQSNQFLASPRG